jgi:hypothetical protein
MVQIFVIQKLVFWCLAVSLTLAKTFSLIRSRRGDAVPKVERSCRIGLPLNSKRESSRTPEQSSISTLDTRSAAAKVCQIEWNILPYEIYRMHDIQPTAIVSA